MDLTVLASRTLHWAIFDITNHLSQKWKRANYYDNFTYTGKLNFPVDFEYTFQLGDDLLQYSYCKSPEGKLVAEKLVVNNKLIFCNKDSILTLDEEEFQMEATTVKTNHNPQNEMLAFCKTKCSIRKTKRIFLIIPS